MQKNRCDNCDITKTFVDSKPAPEDYFKINPKTGKPFPVEFKDEKVRGFILRVTADGMKSYLVRARIKGGENIAFTIGRHGSGQDKTYTADGARRKAREILGQMANGIDPRLVLKDAKTKATAEAAAEEVEQNKSKLTLRTSFDDFCKNNRQVKDSTKSNYESVLTNHVNDWLDTPMADISPDMVLDRYTQVLKQSKSSAVQTFKIVSRLFRTALAEQEDLPPEERILTRNPVRVLSRKKAWEKIPARVARIQSDDLPAWFAAVNSLPSTTYRAFFLLALITGMRKSELFGLRWSTDVDFKNKTFTARNTKNHSDHCMPMTPFVEQLLKSLPQISDYALPGRNGGRATSVENWEEIVIERSGITFTPHALRRTFANMAEDAGVGYGQLQALLNHKPNGVTQESYLAMKDAKRMRAPLEKAEAYILAAAEQRIRHDLSERKEALVNG